jgi:hypothetical protein
LRFQDELQGYMTTRHKQLVVATVTETPRIIQKFQRSK